MNNDLEFKAYIKKLNWIVPVERINFDCKTVEVDLSSGQGDPFEYDFKEIELMQYTGFVDRNREKIYSGDKVKVTIDGVTFISEIVFKTGSFIIAIKEPIISNYFDNNIKTLTELYWNQNIQEDYIDCLAIIGNIYIN